MELKGSKTEKIYGKPLLVKPKLELSIIITHRVRKRMDMSKIAPFEETATMKKNMLKYGLNYYMEGQFRIPRLIY